MKKDATPPALKKKIAELLISLRRGPAKFTKTLKGVLPLLEHLADFKMLAGICDNLGRRFSAARKMVLDAWEKASWMAQVKLELRRPRGPTLEWVRLHQFEYVVIAELSHAASAIAAAIRALLGQLQGRLTMRSV